MSLLSVFHISASPVINIISIFFLTAVSFPILTYIITLIRFQISFHSFQTSQNANINKSRSLAAPSLPIIVPFIGNAFTFLSTTPHQFFKSLFNWYPRSLGAVSILLGGKTTTVIFNPASTSYIMRDRKMGRDDFNEQVLVQALGLSKDEALRYYEYGWQMKNAGLEAQKPEIESGGEQRMRGHELHEKQNLDYLLRTERVNELTTEFSNSFREELLGSNITKEAVEFPLNGFMRGLMFAASTTALWGTTVLEACPGLEERFFEFDQDILTFFFGLPRFVVPQKYANREKTMGLLLKWYEANEKKIGGEIPDPEEVAWEPCWGSRFNRARQLFYRKQGFSLRARAGLDLGTLFAISSNAIPATGWVLMHAIDSMRPERAIKGERSLYDYIMAEVEEAQNPDGSINVPVLVNQPILLSTLHEVLRLHVDVLVSRQVLSDTTIPLQPKGENAGVRSLFLKAGSLLMLPTYPAHTDPTAWQSVEFPNHPSPNVFYPYRFLTAAPDSVASEKPKFTTAHVQGAFFPFGGGKTMCPGRVFARQEMLAGVAIMLLTFKFEFKGYVDGNGKSSPKFPGLRDSLPGSGVMVASGDMIVKLSKKR